MDRPFVPAPSFSLLHSKRVVVALCVVALIHLTAIYAFTTGLATRIIRQVPEILQAEIVKPPPPKTHPRPPPPKPELMKPTVPTVAQPEIRIKIPPRPRVIKHVRQIAQPAQRQIARPISPPPAPAPVVAAPPSAKPAPVSSTPARPIAATHTIPPYPAMAQRLGWEGAVVLALDISPGGTVENAAVVQSSGHAALDKAAEDWVKSNWRYTPARRNGTPVASRARVRVLFNLRNAGGPRW